jgi:dihydrofolate reductase
MSNKVVCDISISADGFVAGPNQTADKPFGDGPVDRLHAWMFDTPDENKAEIERIVSAGAFVMGRNMFGPGRGQWDPSGWVGGAMTRPTMPPCSCSPTIRAHR